MESDRNDPKKYTFLKKYVEFKKNGKDLKFSEKASNKLIEASERQRNFHFRKVYFFEIEVYFFHFFAEKVLFFLIFQQRLEIPIQIFRAE